MSSTTLSKTDFIKFNVSPTFKTLAQKRAKAYGMTLSELGRMLFGAFVSDVMAPSASKKLLELAQQAKENYRKGRVKSFTTVEEMLKYHDTL